MNTEITDAMVERAAMRQMRRSYADYVLLLQGQINRALDDLRTAPAVLKPALNQSIRAWRQEISKVMKHIADWTLEPEESRKRMCADVRQILADALEP